MCSSYLWCELDINRMRLYVLAAKAATPEKGGTQHILQCYKLDAPKRTIEFEIPLTVPILPCTFNTVYPLPYIIDAPPPTVAPVHMRLVWISEVQHNFISCSCITERGSTVHATSI